MIRISTIIINKLSRLKNRNEKQMRWLLDAFEFFTVIMTIPIAYLITFNILNYLNYSWVVHMPHVAVYGLVFVFSWFVLSQVTSMAKLPRTQRYLNAVFLFVRGYFFIFLTLFLFKYAFNLWGIPLLMILVNVSLSMVITLIIRLSALHFLRIYRASGYNLRNVLVIGDDCSNIIINKFSKQKDWGFKIRAIISQSPGIKRRYGKEIPILPGTENIEYILGSQVIDEVFYCKRQIDEKEVRKIIQLCNEIGVVFRVQSSESSIEPLQVQFKTMNPTGNLTLVDIPSHKLAHDIKTIGDIVFSFIALVLLSPVLLLVAFLIKIDSKGPVFYKQERVGLRGRKFRLYKFRTMVVNAEEQLEKLMAKNEMDGPTFKMKDDPRITKLGKFLRKTGIDEFPQLFNVIRGEMSLIGPRPPIEAEVVQYERWQLRRLSVKPGITCTWQIMPQRNDIKFEKWMRMDLNYIDNWSLYKDFRLIFQTITAMILANGR